MKLNRIFTSICTLALLASSGAALSHPHPSFKYAGLGHATFNSDEGTSIAGYAFEGGFKFTNNIFVEVGYTWIDDSIDVSGSTFDFDMREARLFLGYRHLLTESSDIYGKIGASNAQGEGDIESITLTVSDSSYSAATGYIYRTGSFQAGIEAEYLKPEGTSGEWVGGVDARWFFTRNWSVGVDYKKSETQDAFTIGVLYHF